MNKILQQENDRILDTFLRNLQIKIQNHEKNSACNLVRQYHSLGIIQSQTVSSLLALIRKG